MQTQIYEFLPQIPKTSHEVIRSSGNHLTESRIHHIDFLISFMKDIFADTYETRSDDSKKIISL